MPSALPATRQPRSLLETVPRGMVLATTILSPWLFGSGEAWAYMGLGFVILSALVIWLLALAQRLELRAPLVTGLLLLLTAYVALQAMPLPLSIVEILNPASAMIERDARTALTALPETGDGMVQQATQLVQTTFSVAPFATRRSLFLMLIYAVAFVLTANTIRTLEQLQRFASAIVTFTFLLAVIADVHRLSGSSRIFWIREPLVGSHIFGPFSNRNHLAATMNMVLGLGLGLVLSSRYFKTLMAIRGWQERSAFLSSRKTARLLLMGFAVMVLAGSVGVSVVAGCPLPALVVCRVRLVLPEAAKGQPPCAALVYPGHAAFECYHILVRTR